MAGNFSKQAFACVIMQFLLWNPLTYAYPSPISDDHMVHNHNYDMIMPDDHEPAESMHYQNFDEFYKADDNGAMSEMEMDESRYYLIRAPQPLNAIEIQLRGYPEKLDTQREKRVQRSLAKGAAMPRSNANDWEKFDYDMLVNNN